MRVCVINFFRISSGCNVKSSTKWRNEAHSQISMSLPARVEKFHCGVCIWVTWSIFYIETGTEQAQYGIAWVRARTLHTVQCRCSLFNIAANPLFQLTAATQRFDAKIAEQVIGEKNTMSKRQTLPFWKRVRRVYTLATVFYRIALFDCRFCWYTAENTVTPQIPYQLSRTARATSFPSLLSVCTAKEWERYKQFYILYAFMKRGARP